MRPSDAVSLLRQALQEMPGGIQREEAELAGQIEASTVIIGLPKADFCNLLVNS